MDEIKERFLEQLTAKKTQLERALVRLRENQREYNDRLAGDNNMDESDHAQHEISVMNNYNLIHRKTEELMKVDLLIRKVIKTSGFGECEDCGDTIPMERLLVVPGTTLCVPCQRELERSDHMRKLSSLVSSHGSRSVRDGDDYDETDTGYDLDSTFIDPDMDILTRPDFEENDPAPSN